MRATGVEPARPAKVHQIPNLARLPLSSRPRSFAGREGIGPPSDPPLWGHGAEFGPRTGRWPESGAPPNGRSRLNLARPPCRTPPPETGRPSPHTLAKRVEGSGRTRSNLGRPASTR